MKKHRENRRKRCRKDTDKSYNTQKKRKSKWWYYNRGE